MNKRKNCGKKFKFLLFSPQQQRLLHWWRPGSPYADYDMVIADGSIRSGKTIACICSFLQFAQDNYSGENFILAGKTIGTLKKNVIGPMLQILRAWGWPYVYHRGGQDNSIEIDGNTYYLYEANNEASQDKLQGLTAAGAYLDEAALMPRSFVDQAVGRCSVAGAKVWLCCNPEGPSHYINTEYILKAKEKHICLLHFTMDDNLSLAEKVKDKYRRMFTGVFYERYILGLWAVADGLIYPMFDSQKHINDTAPKDAVWYISIDYGTYNPFSAGLWCVAGEKAFRADEYYYSGRESQGPKTDEEYYVELEKLAGNHYIERIVVDPSASSFIECIRRHGRFKVRTANNNVIEGIRNVSTALHRGLLQFSPQCKDTIREFGLYSWDDKSQEDRPIKENDHAMDDVRYFVNTILRREWKWLDWS